jgi:hypothetical protein
MMKHTVAVLFVVIASLFAVAQDKPAESPLAKTERPLSFYKVEYVLRELQDGKAINSRNYAMSIEDGKRGEAKVGARVPVSTGMVGGIPQFQYLDVGVNLLCVVEGKGDYASLRTTIEISSFAIPEQATAAVNSDVRPVLRQMRAELPAVVPLAKPTVIGTVDDVNSTKRYEVSVTATKLK